MTVRVTQKMRKRIDVMKYFKKTKKEKELVTDGSYKEIRAPRDEKQKWIYTTPDDGKTIYREPLSYCDVSGVKIDEGEQLEFNFNNINKSKRIIENDFNPLSDMRASSQYRKIVSQNLLERFYLEVKNNRSETIN